MRRTGTLSRGHRTALAALGLPLLALALLACSDAAANDSVIEVPAGASAARGEQAIEAYGCGTCHTIPGVNGANGVVGPPLTDFGRRLYIAGAVPNNFENLQQWLISPDSIEPGTLMPVLGLSEQQAADIAAYLATLR